MEVIWQEIAEDIGFVVLLLRCNNEASIGPFWCQRVKGGIRQGARIMALRAHIFVKVPL